MWRSDDDELSPCLAHKLGFLIWGDSSSEEKRQVLERMYAGIDWVFQGIISSRELISVRRRRIWRPPTDVYETDSHVVVKVEVAGMGRRAFRISLANRTLTITGRREDPAAKLAYQQMEINYGDFRTEVYLPCPVVEKRIEASYKDGFLIVRLPKVKRRVPIVTSSEVRSR